MFGHGLLVCTERLNCCMLLHGARNASRVKATDRNQQIDREFRTKVRPVLDYAQVVSVIHYSVCYFYVTEIIGVIFSILGVAKTTAVGICK